MIVKLLHHSPLWLASHAIRMSHDNHGKSDTCFHNEILYDLGVMAECQECSCTYDCTKETPPECGDKDRELIARVGNKLKHKSVLEQLVYWFDIDGISRACLQELARHRTARLTVKSSRYTLKELKDVERIAVSDWCVIPYYNKEGCSAAIIETMRHSLLNIQYFLREGRANDQVKYMLPEAFKTRLQWQIDGRNLQNFLVLRTSKDALWEIRLLAKAIYDALPSEHKYLYSEYVMDSTNDSVIDDNTETTD